MLSRAAVLLLSGLSLSLAAVEPVCAQKPVAPVRAAGAAPSVGEPAYRTEFTYGLSSNSNSGLIAGGMIRSTHYWRPDWYWFWSLELNEVKNRKETRVQSRINGDIFIRGKTNFLYALRPSFGVERVVFHKAAEQGVQVSALFSGGPSIGFEVPYYIYYANDPDPLPLLPQDVRRERYDPKPNGRHELDRIAGSASFTSGLAEAKPIPGIHLRAALAFEYGRFRESVTGLEAGALFEAYTRRPMLVPQTTNPQVFGSVYLTLYLGRRS